MNSYNRLIVVRVRVKYYGRQISTMMILGDRCPGRGKCPTFVDWGRETGTETGEGDVYHRLAITDDRR